MKLERALQGEIPLRKFIVVLVVVSIGLLLFAYSPELRDRVGEILPESLPELPEFPGLDSIPGIDTLTAEPSVETVEGELTIVHLNVGQGDATLILGPAIDGDRVSVLMDAGDIPNSGDLDGGAIVLSTLVAYGVDELDYFVASHYDADHIGGVITGSAGVHGSGFVFGPDGAPGSVGDDDGDGVGDWLGDKKELPDPEELGTADDIRVRFFVDRGDEDAPDTRTYEKYAGVANAMGTRVSLDTQDEVDDYEIDLGAGAVMRLYAANGYVRNRSDKVRYVNTENERSLCFVVTFGTFDYLIGGDTIGQKYGDENAKVERAIGEALVGDGIDVEVYRVNHHGGNNGSSAEFLALIRPEIAVISVGDSNTHGHPHVEVLQRLRDAGVQRILQTQRGKPNDPIPLTVKQLQEIADGDVVVTSDGAAFSIAP